MMKNEFIQRILVPRDEAAFDIRCYCVVSMRGLIMDFYLVQLTYTMSLFILTLF